MGTPVPLKALTWGHSKHSLGDTQNTHLGTPVPLKTRTREYSKHSLGDTGTTRNTNMGTPVPLKTPTYGHQYHQKHSHGDTGATENTNMGTLKTPIETLVSFKTRTWGYSNTHTGTTQSTHKETPAHSKSSQQEYIGTTQEAHMRH